MQKNISMIVEKSELYIFTIRDTIIRYNKADYGGGMKVHATGSYVKTVQ